MTGPRPKVPYASYDPNEDPTLVGGISINVERAKELKATPMSWAAVGYALAKEEGRRMPYTRHSVANAVWRHDRKLRGEACRDPSV